MPAAELTAVAPPEPEPEQARATDAELAPISAAPAGSSEEPEATVQAPLKPARRVLAPTARAQPAFPLKTALIVAAPLTVVVLLIGGTWVWMRRPPAPPPPVVQKLPVPPPPPVVVAPPPAPPTEEPKPPPAPVPMLSGKPVVLEYDVGADAAELPGANPALVAKARDAYRKGNARLAAGDKKGAIKLYRASLKFYPAYVGALRGLGRALAASGDKKAINVLKLYVKTVPEAEDVGAINALIEKLGKKPPARRR